MAARTGGRDHHTVQLAVHDLADPRVDVSSDRHDLQAMTGLPAADILANWKTYLLKFRKVMPVEYRRALKELKANADSEPKIAIGA